MGSIFSIGNKVKTFALKKTFWANTSTLATLVINCELDKQAVHELKEIVATQLWNIGYSPHGNDNYVLEKRLWNGLTERITLVVLEPSQVRNEFHLLLQYTQELDRVFEDETMKRTLDLLIAIIQRKDFVLHPITTEVADPP